MNGTTTRSGYAAIHADGSQERPDWRQPHATPRLNDLIQRERPDVLVVNLGANMRGSSPEGIRRQVRELSETARANGTRIVWVGPPNRASDHRDSRSMDAFNQTLRDAVSPYGTYVDSRTYTREYAGGDGIHFSGPRGSQISRDWAAGVFEEIQRG